MFQNGFDEAIHILADIDNDVIIRWAKINNETIDYQDDGTTTIDFEEPFVLKYFFSLKKKSKTCHKKS